MFSYHVFRQDDEKLLAICDGEILGKKFEGGGMEIEVSDFYSGSECGTEKAVDLAKEATVINAVGNRIIKLLIERKFVEKDSVVEIGGVSHAQVVLI